MPIASCDICLGSDLIPHRETERCGRRLVTCAQCGLVAAADPPAIAPFPSDRDPRADARRAVAVARLLPGGRILDVGCGEGHFLDLLDPARFEVAGVEPDPDAAAAASSRLGRSRSRGTIMAGGLTPSRFEPESFDLAVLFGTLEHVASPRAILMETVRLLRPGGQVVIETHSLSTLTARLMGSRWRPLSDPDTLHIFDRPSLLRLVLTCGLVPTATRTALPTGWPRPGSLLCTARKTSETLRTRALSEISSVAALRKATPQGA